MCAQDINKLMEKHLGIINFTACYKKTKAICIADAGQLATFYTSKYLG